MNIVWGIVVVIFALIAWGGQTISLFSPVTAARWGLIEKEESVGPLYWADIRAEARCDFLTLWTLLVAGVLLLADAAAWPYFGLIGGGSYVYFAGRGVLARLEMQRGGFRIGSRQSVQTAYIFLTAWGVIGAITIIAAAVALAS